MTLCLQIEKRRIEKGRKGGEKRRFHVSCDYFILTCTNGGPCSDPPGGGLTLLQTLALIYIYIEYFIFQHVGLFPNMYIGKGRGGDAFDWEVDNLSLGGLSLGGRFE